MYLQIMEQVRACASPRATGRRAGSCHRSGRWRRDLKVSVITVKRAYLDLEAEGVIVTRHGKGSFVAEAAGPACGRTARARSWTNTWRAAARIAAAGWAWS
jgi:GntR family transcriptional regulator